MAQVKEIRVPDIGDFDGVPVIEVLVQPGDSVQKDQGLITLESDKATMEVPSPGPGTIKEVKVSEGDEVAEGTVIATYEPDESGSGEASDDDAESEAEKAPEKASGKKPADTQAGTGNDTGSKSSAPAADRRQGDDSAAQASGDGAGDASSERETDAGEKRTPPVPFDANVVMPGDAPYASPAVRAFARELGVDLHQVKGSGRKGRIVREDVQDWVKHALASGARPSGGSSGGGSGLDLLPWPKVDFAKFGEIEEKQLSRIKKISGANLARNWAMIPHVTQHDQADITEMEAFRKKLGRENDDLKVTPLVFLIKAMVAALKQFPQFNASLDASGEKLILKKYFHIGIAVDTPDGLVVPVLRDCEKKGLLELARELGELSGKAREKKLGPAQMSGGCISISSLGGIGGTAFTPIVNAPEVAILGVSRSSMQPVWDGESFQPRLMLPLSLSYDHRVVDGADAARFTAYLARVLGDIRRLLL
ncbi:dihydrolipoyllysine-residue acetyltransferase [Oleiagrimonas sp.]|jgi:pyruvate dehydrogenase E2 component (dihydrolipoamide acetyltransferase)|uniref:dihydrolipoyllysine-residue acetyltransferase n=1 Tax=Oleiagrimonas sp. TaxID=2010330 RepID=UPI0026058C1F|nr:dihydrolipoyllysine-residue acetyltransferase [Oleiagrimonas sp.]MDA3914884.1 dihydrolipoyllysine-residue acetyltransferase [Oleiagrimonas sp.]